MDLETLTALFHLREALPPEYLQRVGVHHIFHMRARTDNSGTYTEGTETLEQIPLNPWKRLVVHHTAHWSQSLSDYGLLARAGTELVKPALSRHWK